VNPQSLKTRRADWVKVIKVWNRIVTYVKDPAHQAEAVKMMAARAGVPADEYAKFMPGTRFLTPEEALKRFDLGMKDNLDTLLGSGKVADEFNVANKVYKDAQPVKTYIDGSLSKEALAKEMVAK
jgi:NitT/TauT family transport system substrate-binding protein